MVRLSVRSKARTYARPRAAKARRKLDRLMPFEEWCSTVKPTDAAKELYRVVRRLLEDERTSSRWNHHTAADKELTRQV
jgi:hypothetical protein